MKRVPTMKPFWFNESNTRKARANSYRRGYDRKWAKFRLAFLAANPICSNCNNFATEVDHKVALEKGGAKFDVSNCQGFCKRCHTRKTNREDGGFGRKCRSDS